ncbi:MAG: aminodeoxychorismate/anthranilate synthase component II [Flavipsychrobacter sp.]|nr:aminodeoxychorismate/anthranilate synthase component II [Flavipsychrobacter sp.]
MWALIDNYDSFTYILCDYLLQTGHECIVYNNDEITIPQLAAINPSRLIISPGAETPLQAGISMDAISYFHNKIPILGVCLGHQAIGMHFGAELVKAPAPMHGKTSALHYTDHPLFAGLPPTPQVMRYHSLALANLQQTGLRSIAHTDDAVIMAIAHDTYPCIGVQFHPESIGTETGLQILKNWAGMYK